MLSTTCWPFCLILNVLKHQINRRHFKNAYELLNLKALKFPTVDINHIFQSMGKIFSVGFKSYPLKFHTKYLTHTLKDVNFN